MPFLTPGTSQRQQLPSQSSSPRRTRLLPYQWLRLRSSSERTRASEANLAKPKTRGIQRVRILRLREAYPSEAFPNPVRIHCPPDAALQRTAEHPIPERETKSANISLAVRHASTATWKFWRI